MRLEDICHQLAVFLEVVRHGSVTRAAETLVISQPAVSTQVRSLERALGVTLFTRDGRGIRLTEAGAIVADYAGRIFGLAGELAEVAADLQGLSAGRLVLGASTTAGEYLLPETLGRFKRAYPGITIELQIANTRRIVDRIVAFDLDLGFIGEDVADDRLIREPYREDEIVPVVAADHPILRRPDAALAEILGLGLIVREPGSATRAAAERHLDQLGQRPAVEMELGSNEAIKRAVAAGAGLAFLSRGSVDPEVRAGLLAVVDRSELVTRRSFWVVYRRGKRLTGPESAFLDFALDRDRSHPPRTIAKA